MRKIQNESVTSFDYFSLNPSSSVQLDEYLIFQQQHRMYDLYFDNSQNLNKIL
jgi:hypothetical protein